MREYCIRVVSLAVLLLVFVVGSNAEVRVGWASVSITPDKPVALAGQFHTRISESVHDPVTATALAIDTGEDQAVLVSCDLVRITTELRERLRKRLARKLNGLDTRKLLLHATHTHTAPEIIDGLYEIPETGVMTPAEYLEFLVGRLAEAVTKAWTDRQPAGVSWALSHAVVGHNRRAVFDGGEAVMYAKVNRADFSHLEGYEDHGVELLFFWTPDQKLTGVVVNVACPSQVVESQRYMSADFWHDVRVALRKRHSKDLHVLAMTGASGDQSPHLLFRKKAEQRMLGLKGVSEREEIADRIVTAIDRVARVAKADIRRDAPLMHHVEDLDLPVRKVTQREFDAAKAERQRLLKLPESDRKRARLLQRAEGVMARYEKQEAEPYYEMELHVIRLGDVAIASNPFELFLDFGIQMKARSPAEQTFVVQHATANGGYVPTARAVAGGGYGAEIASNKVGPEGGKVLVDRTVELIEGMWDKAAK